MDENKNQDDTLNAVMCWDSETGKKYLIDRKTGQVLSSEDDDAKSV